ncbi:MAG TPA: protein kinase [Vicinamibacterales bacterium]|nr:protein kinase [Vicinamibacterales bacterium]
MSSSSLSGRTLAGYEVGPLVGAGGMGEVYRARDSQLNRDVAIKILLPAVANDADRLARFRREAQVLASLNHQNIAHIHGIEQAEAGPFLVMEFVEGPTLADRIAQGPIPVDEALAIARQIADALEAAHERGVIHRDLKPANIKVRDDGAVKVLDFGLAKALEPATGTESGPAANSPTITTPAMTQAGIILGTAAYMSPEQAKGRVLDKRTDVWAFGCVLYEMLTARRAFDGEDITETIAAIVRAEPNWDALPGGTPPYVRLLLKRCLEKDRRARIADISVARFLLNERIDSVQPVAAMPVPASRFRGGRLAMAAVLGVCIGGALVAAWLLTRVPVLRGQVRFSIVPAPTQPLAIQGNDHDIAFAPDGSYVVYRSGDARAQIQLVVRPINELEGRPLAGTTAARNAFISPDGRWVGFAALGELRKVSISGGPVITICKLDGALRGASWGEDGSIVFSTAGLGAIRRVSSQGGEPEVLTKPDRAGGEIHGFPVMLPGAKAVLYTSAFGGLESTSIRALNLTNGQQTTVISGAHDAAYVDGDVLFYAMSRGAGSSGMQGSLRAVRFDPLRLEVSGESVGVLDQLAVFPSAAAGYALSRRGDLAYILDRSVTSQAPQRSLVWVNRQGQETAIGAPSRAYGTARLSPDESRVAVDVRSGMFDIWLWDLTRKTLTALNSDSSQDIAPLWTPDGHRIIWTSTRGGGNPNLYWQASDGTGPVERLSTAYGNQFPTSISPDGTQLLLFGSAGQNMDLFRMRLAARDQAEPLWPSPASEYDGEISPDGKWLAYHSDESGEFQVYVRPFPNVQEGRFPVSNAGGTRPVWAHSGRELFYLDANGFLTSVTVQVTAETFSAGTPTKILNTKYHAGSSILNLDLRAYDVSRDGKRFLMMKENPSAEPPRATSDGMIVVLNWLEEVNGRLRGQ